MVPLPVVSLTAAVLVVVAYIFRRTIAKLLRSFEAEKDEERMPLIQTVELVKTLRMGDIPWSNVLTLFVNGTQVQLVNPDPFELLSAFIRDKVGLKGTKLGCEEGGCGACTVVLTKPEGVVSVNSCLRPLCANDGMAVTTVEGIGSSKDLSPEQSRLVKANGTQCGYCTPGWISNMAALNAANELAGTSSTKREIDAYLDGNICRCTGYRPILQAFQSFAEGGSAPSVSACSSTSTSACASASAPTVGCAALGCSDAKQQHCTSQGHDLNSCCGDVEEMGSACASSASGCPSASASGCPSASASASAFGCQVVAGVARSKGARRAEKDLALVRKYSETAQPLLFTNNAGQRWIRPVNLAQLCAVLREVAPNSETAQTVQLVGGNTSVGVTKYLNGTAPYNAADKVLTYIDVNKVDIFVLQDYEPSGQGGQGVLTVGAACTISTLIGLLLQHAPPSTSGYGSASGSVSQSESPSGSIVDHHSVFSVTAHHLLRVANTQVRNAGSWAGNLMVFLRYPTFPSDAVLALTTAGAVLKLSNQFGQLSEMSMGTFLGTKWEDFQAAGLMIVAVSISEVGQGGQGGQGMGVGQGMGQGKEFITETFKVAQRLRNAHASVNAGFQLLVQHNSHYNPSPVCLSARIVFGGVSDVIFVATRTQNVLLNAPINSNTLQRALAALQGDLAAAGRSRSELGSPVFRESAMNSFLYRALLRCFPAVSLPPSLLSVVQPWVIPISRGVELFLPGASADEGPVGRPLRKLEGPAQATGEAVYPSDVAKSQQLFGCLVYSTQCAKKLLFLDPTRALAVEGVVAVLTALDVPQGGSNKGIGSEYLFVPVGGLVECVGAQLGVVVAHTERAAAEAAALVGVTYEETGVPPIVTLEQAISAGSTHKGPKYTIQQGDVDQALAAAPYTSKGTIAAGGQYHFYMETQAAIANLDGANIEVTCGHQNPGKYQSAVASLLGITQNQVTIKCPRTGGAFGGKLSRGVPATCAAALGTYLLGRPVRVFNSRTADMNQQAGREGWMCDYEVGYSADGTITALKYTFSVDAGIEEGDTGGSVYMGMNWADNAYFFPNYQAKAKLYYTNTPARTSMRAPGVVQTCLCTEMVVQRVAAELSLPPTTVQTKNFIQDGKLAVCGQVVADCTLPTVWNTLLARSQYDRRMEAAKSYNRGSLWRKRGLAVCPVKYGMGWAGYNAGATIGINAADGSITLHHNGSEIGQGINTKAAQAAAYALGVDISLICVGAADTSRVVNGGATGGSGTSEVVVQACINACQKINDRLAPYRTYRTLGRGGAQSTSDWVALLSSLPSDVSLNAEGWFSPTQEGGGQPFQYFVYAACVTEIELDVLSGEVHVLASEIVYDCGQSLNPAIDCGQIEGALVMGLGYFLTEKVQFNAQGQLLTSGTWEYKPPLAQEVPALLTLTLLKNVYNKEGILGSKAVGEPPYIVANSVYFAVKDAVLSARADAGVTGHFEMAVPCGVEERQGACLVGGRLVMPC